MLLRDVSAGHRGLWHQRVHTARAGCVCEPLRPVGVALAARRRCIHADADDGVSRVLAKHDSADAGSATELCRVAAYSAMGGTEDTHRGEWTRGGRSGAA